MKVGLNIISNNFLIAKNRVKVSQESPLASDTKNSSSANYNISKNYNNLINFTSKNYFKIIKLEGMSCPICEQMMLNQRQIDEFVVSVSDKKAEALKEALEKYEDDRNISKNGTGKTIYRPFQQIVVDVLKEMAEKYPNQDLQALCFRKAKQIINHQKRHHSISKQDRIVRSFFESAYNKRLSSQAIANNLISSATATREHLVPKVKEGTDGLFNNICDCKNCNRKREDTDFSEWIKDYPNIKQNIEKHFEFLLQAIENQSLPPNYCQYMKDASNTIYKLSDYKIKPNLPSKINEVEKNCFEKLELKRQTVHNLKTIQDEYRTSRLALYDEIKNLEADMESTQSKEEFETINSQISDLTRQAENLTAIISSNSAIMREINKLEIMTDAEFEKTIEGFIFL